MDMNGSGAVDFAAVAAEQARRQQELAQKLEDAMQRPLIVETATIVALAVRQDGEQKILSIATPDGRRRDFPINTVVEQSLRLALFPPKAQAA